MEKIVIYIETEEELPIYGSKFASGFDVKANLANLHHFQTVNEGVGITANKDYMIVDNALALLPGKRCMIPTGLKFAIPYNYELQVRPRSGNAINLGLTVLNTPGTIDSDYRGECCVILINTSDKVVMIPNGFKVAQFVLCPVGRADFNKVKDLPDSERGGGGFGSTDK